MLKLRSQTAIVLFILSFVVLFVLPESMFIVVILLFALAGAYEIIKMYHFNLISQVGLMLLMIVLAFLLCATAYDSSQIMCIVSVITWCFIVPLILIWRPQNFSYLALWGLNIIIFLPAFYAAVMLHSLLGSLQLFTIMAIAWIADMGAFFIGQRFGRHKLAPLISSGKTIEGALGGLFFVIIYLLLLKHFNLTVYLFDYPQVFKFALILATASIVGDLVESWLKRVAKVKDSGSILPGHGGVFDRIDSLVAVLAIAFAMIRGFV